jgi:hypothetical protein
LAGVEAVRVGYGWFGAVLFHLSDKNKCVAKMGHPGWLLLSERTKSRSRSPFDFAQGRLSAPLKCASLRMTGSIIERYEPKLVPLNYF